MPALVCGRDGPALSAIRAISCGNAMFGQQSFRDLLPLLRQLFLASHSLFRWRNCPTFLLTVVYNNEDTSLEDHGPRKSTTSAIDLLHPPARSYPPKRLTSIFYDLQKTSKFHARRRGEQCERGCYAIRQAAAGCPSFAVRIYR